MQNKKIFEAVLKASRSLPLMSEAEINQVLLKVADAAEANKDFILQENKKDLSRMDPEDPKYDRLLLTAERIDGIAADIRNVSKLKSPLGKQLMETERPNGMKISKVTVPFGVIGIIYEARPNVSFDVFSLCFKSGNACVLKGGSDAADSNKAIVKVIKDVLIAEGVSSDILQLLPPDRESTAELLNAHGYVDLLIPRGSAGLINYVRENATIPVIETGAGICHTYVDKAADVQKAADIVFNAKTRRPSVCNALDCMVIHKDKLGDLPKICDQLKNEKVIIYADPEAYSELKESYPADLLKEATPESFGTEFLSLKMSVKTVDSFENAVEYVSDHTSKHSECIVSEDQEAIERYLKVIDAGAVYANVSTAFTDGAQFGLGAEIGISTQKLHARGPMALEELTSYKWIVKGNGQVRPK
ncbi:glutamate-5-semialdehyde dehydrogenase [Saccharicrinis sp. FJH2]|uniref:glutamate-5-semialdehyde dehydrogenase n=1 Tax=Saccharicrinis sp. FJH65 TaxID=3344659 RepID=UPI0035F3D9BD